MSNLRQQTRDLIPNNMDCGCKPPPMPSGGYSLSVFSDMMFQVARNNGYVGTKNQFEDDFIASLNGASGATGLITQKGSVNDFPEVGVPNGLYIDVENKKAYFWTDDEGYCLIDTGGSLQTGVILDGGKASFDD